jgi:selenocysteine-specific elongation factor
MQIQPSPGPWRMTDLPKSVVIGTAGHIDHGKTTLVRALTGIDADRLPEERRRGITIDLGFASLELQAHDGTPLSISFVDVPGHSLFVRNMLAGAGCVPAVMLVIAANEGVMPQTVEHLAICELLGISQGITVVTKADTVSPAQLEEVTHAIDSFLTGTFLERERAPVLTVSAATGNGLNALKAELLSLALRSQFETSRALLRMPLDRAFVMKGFGTVVTGTLLSGTIHEGQTLLLEPQGRAVRVRGLQTNGQVVESAQPGSRVAVNVSGVDVAEVRRGQTLVSPNTLSAVDTVDVEITLLPGAPILKPRAKLHFHAFTSETMASAILYGYEAVQPGTARLARIRLAEPIVLVPGDRFVLRQPLPVGTIGGGRILDGHPEPRQRKDVTRAWLDTLKDEPSSRQTALRVNRRTTCGIALGTLCAESGLNIDAVREQIGPRLESDEPLLLRGDLLLSRDGFKAAMSAVMSRLLTSRQEIKRSELRSQTGLSNAVFEFALAALVRMQTVRLREEMVSMFHAEQQSSIAEDERLAAIAQAYEAAGLASPLTSELAQRLNMKEAEIRRIVTLLQRNKTIVRMGSDDLFIHSGPLMRLAERLAALRGSFIDVARFKQFTGLSRKYAIPILEYLDHKRVTRKQGDKRLVL